MKITYILTALLLTATAFSQKFEEKKFDQYSFEVNYGVSASTSPALTEFGHFAVGFRYMIDKTWGIKIEYAQDKFRDAGVEEELGSDYKRYSVQAVANIGPYINSEMQNSKVGLLAHGGVGYASVNSILTPGTDNTVHLMAGLTPQYKISDSFSFNFDLTLILNFTQHIQFDGKYPQRDGVTLEAFTGKLINASAGITFYPPMRKGRADWNLD